MNDIGRNDPCPCGSGIKYKKCCMPGTASDSVTSEEVAGIRASAYKHMSDEKWSEAIALFKSILDATAYSSNKANRKEISAAISPKNYLNQPTTVVEQVLTGRFADGLGKVRNEPDRIDFDPFPWHSMAVWILTQMKRWGYVEGDINYKQIAEQVYLATDAADVMKSMGQTPPGSTYANYTIMGKEFDPTKPDEYISSFAIKRT